MPPRTTRPRPTRRASCARPASSATVRADPSMSLRSKIVLILVTVVVAYAALDNSVQRFLAGESFGRLERDIATERLTHVRQRIEGELANLSSKAGILAGTHDVIELLRGHAEGGGGLGPILAHAGADLLYVLDAEGRVQWSSVQ